MSIDRWMDKEVVIHVYNVILLCHKKEYMWFTWTEGSTKCDSLELRVKLEPVIQSEVRKRIISYIKAYIWNLEKWYWWTYLKGRNRNTKIENRVMDTVGGEEGRMNWESNIETCILSYVKQVASGKLLYNTRGSTQHSVTIWRSSMGEWDRGWRRRSIYVLMADSNCCMAETITTL